MWSRQGDEDVEERYSYQSAVHHVPTTAQVGVLTSHHAFRYHLQNIHVNRRSDALQRRLALTYSVRESDVHQ